MDLLTLFLEHANAVVVVFTAAAILYTRSAGVIYFTAGALVCSRTVWVVKRLIRQPRPTHPLPGKQKKTYGMPSTHSAVVAYYTTYTLLACAYLPIHSSLPQSTATRVIAPSIIVPGCTAVAISRIWLGHHSIPQVAVGCAHGLVFTYMWYSIWIKGGNIYGNHLEQLYLANIF